MSSLSTVLIIKKTILPILAGMAVTLSITMLVNKLNFRETTELITFTDKDSGEKRNLEFYQNSVKKNEVKYVDARLLKPIDIITNFNWSIYANIINTIIWGVIVVLCVGKISCLKDELTTLSEIDIQ